MATTHVRGNPDSKKASQRSLVAAARQASDVPPATRTARLTRYVVRACLSHRETLEVGALVTTGLVIASALIAWRSTNTAAPHDQLLSILTGLLSAQASLAAIALPLLVFVIEGARHDSMDALSRSHEVLLRRTAVLPILCAALGGIVAMAFSLASGAVPGHAWLFAAILLGTVVGTVFAFYRSVALISSPVRLRRATVDVLKEKMKTAVEESLDLHLGNEYLKQITEEAGLLFSPYSRWLPADPEVFNVTVKGEGVLTDFDVYRLRDLLQSLEHWSLRSEQSSAAPTVLNLQPSIIVDPPPPQWTVALGSLVTSDTPALQLSKRHYDALRAHEVSASLSKLITFSAEQPPIEAELSHARDIVLASLRGGLRERVLEHCALYESLVHQYMKTARDRGARAQAESAASLSTALNWVERHLTEIIEEAVAVGSMYDVQEVVGVAYGLALQAVTERDLETYKRFINLLEHVYRRSATLTTAQGMAACEAVAFRFSEMSNAKLATTFGQEPVANQRRLLLDFWRHLFLRLMRLMKEAVDQRRLDSYVRLSRALDDALDEFAIARTSRFENGIREVGESPGIRQVQYFARLGAVAWALRRYQRGLLAPAEIGALLATEVPALGGAETLWRQIDEALRPEVEERLQWSHWILFEEERPAGVGVIDFTHYLWLLFALAGLTTLQRQPDRGLILQPTKAGKAAAYGHDAPLMRAVRQAAEDEHKAFAAVGLVFEEDVRASLETAVRQASRAQELREEAFIINENVSDALVERTARNLKQAFVGTAVLRVACSGWHSEERDGTSKGSELSLGYFVLDRKDVHVESSGQYADDWGSLYGRELAIAEDQAVVDWLIATLPTVSIGEEEPDWATAVCRRLPAFKTTCTNPCIIIVGVPDAAWHLGKLATFERRYGRGHGYLGELDGIPVHLTCPRSDPCAALVDTTLTARWLQLEPRHVLPTEAEIGAGLWFGVQTIDGQEAARLIEADRSLVETQGRGDETEAARQLQLQVKLRVSQKLMLARNTDDVGSILRLQRHTMNEEP